MSADPARLGDVLGDIVPLVLAGAREESTTTTPDESQEGVVVGAVGVASPGAESRGVARSDSAADAPPSQAEVEQLGRQLRGWHGGSLRIVFHWASQMPRSVFAAAFESVRDSDSARSPVAVLVSILRDEVQGRYASTMQARASGATAAFGYSEPSPTEQLRADPERWVRQVAPRAPTGVVDDYLTQHVADEVERQRLRRLADELRESA